MIINDDSFRIIAQLSFCFFTVPALHFIFYNTQKLFYLSLCVFAPGEKMHAGSNE